MTHSVQGESSPADRTDHIPPSRILRRSSRTAVLAAALVTLGAVGLAGCGGLGAGEGKFAYDATCPDGALVTVLDFDLSASGRDQRLLSERVADARGDFERTADCGGRVIVGAHSTSSAATVTLIDEPLDPRGSTEIARDRRIRRLVDGVQARLVSALDDAMKRLPADGSDLTAAATWVGDQASQRSGPDVTVEATVYSDAISNVGPLALAAGSNAEDARRTAAAAPAPSLSALAAFRVEGVGHVAGRNQPPSDFVAAVSAQTRAYAERGGAGRVVVLTALTRP